MTDLSMDYRCYKEAVSLSQAGFEPIILCDKPLHALGSVWKGMRIRELTPISHLRHFALAFLWFHIRLIGVLLFTRSKYWISLDCAPLLTLGLMGKLRGATVVYDSHELFTQTPMVLSRPGRRRFWTFWHDFGLRFVPRVTVVSPSFIEWFQSRFPKHRYLLLPNAPPLQNPPPIIPGPRPGETVRLIYQGGLRHGSGLLETVQALKSWRPGALQVYGKGPERAALDTLIAEGQLASRVIFHGQVPFEALKEPMIQSHIGLNLVQPICGNFALTLANKLFDYIHVGLPVLLSDNPAHRAFLKENPVGLAVDSFSPQAIAEGLQALTDHWESYHAACLKAREHWHWQGFARELPAFLIRPLHELPAVTPADGVS